MSNPGNYTIPTSTPPRHSQPDAAPEPPVDVRLEHTVSVLAHDWGLSYDEANAVRALLMHDQELAVWYTQAEARKPDGVRNEPAA